MNAKWAHMLFDSIQMRAAVDAGRVYMLTSITAPEAVTLEHVQNAVKTMTHWP
jgi:hypothetical protein